MSISLNFIRMAFILLSILFLTAYAALNTQEGPTIVNLLLGVLGGAVLGALLVASDNFLKKFSLRSLNIVTIGLFIGYLLGTAILMVLNASLELTRIPISNTTLILFKTIIYLICCYISTFITAWASEELYLSIPFVRFKATANKKKDILIDASILLDSRIIDLSASGLLNGHLILPRFTLKELYVLAENGDENVKAKARRSLDVCKKLENIPNLDLRFSDTDFPEIKDPINKLVRLARLTDANIITADINRIQQSSIEGIVVINIHSLSNALKPLTQTGEHIFIKIQRYGKEARQGVGYLEDGTMVVVNGGAEHIGETIKGQVLSVKHTSSGRMIFCNAADEEQLSEHEISSASESALCTLENGSRNYFGMDNLKYPQ